MGKSGALRKAKENLMAYPEDLVGRFIGWKLDQGQSGLSGATRHPFTKLVHSSVAVTAQVFTNPNGTGRLQLPWSFRFLKYIEGETTVCHLGTGVLTGPLSGCWIFRYNGQGGASVAHVGTVGATDKRTVEAKQTWVLNAGQTGNTQIVGVRTSDIQKIVLDVPRKAKLLMVYQDAPPYVQNLYTSCYYVGQNAYMIVMAKNRHNPDQSMVLDVRKVTPQPWSSVQQLREFRDLF